MNFVVLGLGNFGHSWAVDVLPKLEPWVKLVGVVDSNPNRFEGLPDSISKFHSIDEAIDIMDINGVINVLPPQLHTEVNKKLLSKGLSVICEKPISDTLEDAYDMVEFTRQYKTPLMIAENYRYRKIFRRVRQMIRGGMLGPITNIRCEFSHFHPDYSHTYHGSLSHPLLSDVTVHHLDIARYITNEEPISAFCKEWDAKNTWYQERMANAVIWSQLTGGIHFQYTGSLAAHVSTTEWHGDWVIEGHKGYIRIKGDSISYKLMENDQLREELIPSDNEDTRVDLMHEFIASIKEGREAETNISDNFKTYLWLEAAIMSSETHRSIDVRSLILD